jgi:hypothetical protein
VISNERALPRAWRSGGSTHLTIIINISSGIIVTSIVSIVIVTSAHVRSKASNPMFPLRAELSVCSIKTHVCIGSFSVGCSGGMYDVGTSTTTSTVATTV